MSNIFQKLGKTRPPPAAPAAGSRLTLAAFGKHPGWDDHMPGIGVDTETLAYLKQTLYVTGIGRQIDSGAWDKLETDKRQEGFDHTFLWLRAGHFVLGQLWSSKDGKGRSKYPMVLCVDGERVSAGLLLNDVRPGLEALRDACKAATAADQVASNCRVAQEQLRALFAGGALPAEPNVPGDDPRRFLERPELGPDRLGLLRVLHELSGSFDIAGATRPPAHGGAASAPSLHLRVPLAADSQNSALLLWAGFLHSAVSADVPLVLMARSHADWLDVVVGEPKADDFFFLQASKKGFPLATQIPYELAPNAMARLREVELRFCGAEASATGGTTRFTAAPPPPKAATPTPPPTAAVPPAAPPPPPKVPPPAPRPTAKVASPTPPPAPKVPPSAPPPANPRAEEPAPPSKRNSALAAGIVLVVLIAAVFLWLSHGKTEEQKHFDQLLASGKALLDEKKFDEAIHDFEEADKLHPQDDHLKHLLDQARQQRDSSALADQYQSAVQNGRASFASGDFANALDQAGKALSLKPGDVAAQQLRDNAQAKLAAIALAQQKETDFQSALKNSRDSFARGDYATALAESGKALSLKPGDAESRKLRDDSQTKLRAIALASQEEAGYQLALKNSRDSFARRDFASTLAEAGKALSFKPGDADARRLRDDAQTQLAALALAAQKEADYQSALRRARASFASGDFTNALAQSDRALSIKHDDPDAAQLRDDAKHKLSAILPQFFTNSIQMEFVRVPALGAPSDFIGKYEVTEKQYQAIMGDLPDGQPVTDANLPVSGVSFPQAAKFCQELSKRENKHYSLPTRQQWLTVAGLSEDAVPDAWKTLSASGALEHEVTSFNQRPPRVKPLPVGSMGAPANGVCDMFGNVREWVLDQQRAGFSYQSNGAGRTGILFLPGSETDTWIEQETGLRCLLQESQSP